MSPDSSPTKESGTLEGTLPKSSAEFEIERTLPRWFPPLFFALLSLLFLWKSSFTGQVFLPADLLHGVSPWIGGAGGSASAAPPWNPLRWDGIAQFYPWRLFAATAIRSGTLPLWNPYQLCGAPFVANSQSAPFYPLNIVFCLLPVSRAFGYSAALHLALAGWFTYLLLRRLRCSEVAALSGGVAFAFSSWQVGWLQLPTFLATSCWIPLILRHAADVTRSNRRTPASIALLGLSIGMMLLAGHLQIAFYGLLFSIFWCFALLVREAGTSGKRNAAMGLGFCAIALAAGGMLSAPQTLPSIELSRGSHRVAKPSSEGYSLYTGYSLTTAGLIQMALPDFFGGDWDPDNHYWGFYTQRVGDQDIAIRHNASETSAYVGISTLILGLLALVSGVAPASKRMNFPIVFFGLMAAFALLMAMGTPIDALFYFYVPGFSQSGSPARVLVIWALAWSILAAFGCDIVVQRSGRLSKRHFQAVCVLLLLVVAFGLSAASRALAVSLPGFKPLVPTLGEAFSRITEDWIRLGVFTAGAFGIILLQLRRIRADGLSNGAQRKVPTGSVAFLVLITADLFVSGMRLNPTSSPESVYPTTPGIAYLQEHAQHDRIYPVNMYWSLYNAPHAILPPNAGMVYGLRDVQGYDSLLPGAYKAWANGFTLSDTRPATLNRRDSSPVEVANIVFFQDPNAPNISETGARFAITPSIEGWNPPQGASPQSAKLPVIDEGMDLYSISSNGRAECITPEGAQAGSIRWLQDGLTRVTLEVSAQRAGTVVLRDQMYPGWHAYYDGAQTEIVTKSGNPVYRAVKTTDGTHTISFVFEPGSFLVGLYLALMAAGLLIALFTYHMLTRRLRVLSSLTV